LFKNLICIFIAHDIVEDYRDPTVQMIKQKLYRTVDMELDEFGNGNYFADYDVFHDLPV